MPKIRGFKPEIWTDERFVSVSPLARLLFMGMWNYACDNGHVQESPSELKMRVLPADECSVKDLLTELINTATPTKPGLVVDRETHLHIPKLRAHQRVDTRYFTSCSHCDPDERTQGTRRGRAGDSKGALRDHPVLPLGTHADGDSDGDSEVKGYEGDGEYAASAKTTKRGSTIPDKWTPNARAVEIARDLRLDLQRESEQFRDFHVARGTVFKSWDAAFYNWLRKADEFRKRNAPTNGAAPSQTATVHWLDR